MSMYVEVNKNKPAKIAVVIGSAKCVFDDLKELELLLPNREDYTIFTVNFATMLPIKPNYICAIHGDYIDTYKAIAQIKAEEFGWAKDFYTISTFGHADYIYDDFGTSGTSGRFTTDIAQHLGHNKVILCGIPMDGTDRFYGDLKHDYSSLIDMNEWISQDADIVRSFSGNTLDLLGRPTKEWLYG